MSKYARFLWRHNEVDHSVHLVDLIDTSVYEPRPSWGQTDDALLSKIFEPNKDQWVADDEWFHQVPDACQPGATFLGEEGCPEEDYLNPDNYINPDGTNGAGIPI